MFVAQGLAWVLLQLQMYGGWTIKGFLIYGTMTNTWMEVKCFKSWTDDSDCGLCWMFFSFMGCNVCNLMCSLCNNLLLHLIPWSIGVVYCNYVLAYQSSCNIRGSIVKPLWKCHKLLWGWLQMGATSIDPHVDISNFTAEINMLLPWFKKHILCIVRFPLYDNFGGCSFLITHLVKLY